MRTTKALWMYLLLILGLLITGSGLWMRYNLVPKIPSHEGDPLVTMIVERWVNRAILRSQLQIYDDGTIISYKEDLRFLNVPERLKRVKVWYSGKLQKVELESIKQLLDKPYDQQYYFSGIDNPGDISISNISFLVIYINYQGKFRGIPVRFSTHSSNSPAYSLLTLNTVYPINEIYRKLTSAMNETKEVAQETYN